MNREQRRLFIKAAKKHGLDERRAVAILTAFGQENKEGIHTGDKVVLNTDKITGRNDFERAVDGYKRFVNDSVGVIYTATVKDSGLVEVQDNGWLFIQSDVIKVG